MRMIKINADKLINDIKKNTDMPLSAICRMMGVSESTFSNTQKRGTINPILFERICGTFGFRREDYQPELLCENKHDGEKDTEEIKQMLSEILRVLKELTYGTKEE